MITIRSQVINKDKQQIEILLEKFLNRFKPVFKYSNEDGSINVFIYEKETLIPNAVFSATFIFNTDKGEIIILVPKSSKTYWGIEGDVLDQFIKFFQG